ncbi:MAG TPA: aminotransferase class III-fold pyridoxal phosphate-dependent enzyme, partial [bacterium]|nr:aminotransferase class III-fold pyridoxal phosphate-dependent enzyme [bacterium]
MSNARRTESGMDAAAVREKHKKYLLPSVANYYETPLVLESGQGLHVRDADGETYLDFFGGILTVSIGHCDPRINGPIKAQVDRLGHVSSVYPVLPVVELA